MLLLALSGCGLGRDAQEQNEPAIPSNCNARQKFYSVVEALGEALHGDLCSLGKHSLVGVCIHVF